MFAAMESTMNRTILACLLLLLPACQPQPSTGPAAEFARGKEALNKKDYDLAIACFNAYIQENPKDAGAFNNRGVAYLRKKEYDKAVKDFSEAIQLNSNLAAIFLGRGSAYDGMKEYDKAVSDYSEAIRLDPKNADAFFWRGAAYNNKKEYDKAISDYSEAIRLDPKHDKALNGLAWSLATCPKDSVRNGKKAVELATKACDLSEWKIANNLDTLAAAHAECGDFKEAVKWQKKAIELGLGDNKETAERPKKRLQLYEDGKPCRND
jgi:tetratricopeptide (TPR) repeat protein